MVRGDAHGGIGASPPGLIDLYRDRFGEHIPLVRRQDVKGFVQRSSVWLTGPLRVDAARTAVEGMELEVRRFYERAATRVTDAKTRQLLSDLALEERKHAEAAESLDRGAAADGGAHRRGRDQRRLFLLQIVQPALAGLMDGSVSTLAPLFAAAIATQDSLDAFLVGIAASVGAGISMGFAEALSDDGSLTGRGQPMIRGTICGVMTTIGGVGHTLPFLIPDFRLAMAIAAVVVALESGGDLVDPVSLHGNPTRAGNVAGGGRGTPRVYFRGVDRQRVIGGQASTPVNRSSFRPRRACAAHVSGDQANSSARERQFSK